MKKYEIIIVGAGPAGYSAALNLKDDFKILCLESKKIGGTCLNRGCIPSKFLINYSKKHKKINQIIKRNIIKKKISDNMLFNFKNLKIKYLNKKMYF